MRVSELFGKEKEEKWIPGEKRGRMHFQHAPAKILTVIVARI
jgi:hypothetical protein